MEGAEHIDEDLVNHGKAARHAESVATPVEVEGGRVVVPVGGKNYSEGSELNKEVAEEKLEFPVQPTLKHDSGDAQLEDGMRDPKRVIKESNLFAHRQKLN